MEYWLLLLMNWWYVNCIILTLIDYVTWIDVSQNNGNLLASSDYEKIIKIFDKRESKIVKTFEGIHSSIFLLFAYLIMLTFNLLYFSRDIINCVRWNVTGDFLATASSDKTTKLLDFKTGKILYTGNSSDGNKFSSI